MEKETEIVTCGRCRGLGKINKDNQEIDCPGCGSSGKLRVNKPATICGRCRGNGWINIDNQKVDCPGCKSSGYFRG